MYALFEHPSLQKATVTIDQSTASNTTTPLVTQRGTPKPLPLPAPPLPAIPTSQMHASGKGKGEVHQLWSIS